LIALADNPRLASIPVIVLTAADDPSKRAPRPATVLIKPVAMEDLVAAIGAASREV
jgi:DNA-binding response OmpR family regulator